MCSSDIFLGILAILFPPIAVWIKRSICSADSIINILLCMLGYIPGLLHAWYIIAKYPEDPDPDTQYAVLSQGERGYYVPQQDGARLQNGTGVREGARGQGPQYQGYGSTAGGVMRVPQQQGGRQGGRQGAQSGELQQGPPSQGPGPSQQGEGVPPSYQEAVKGDNKVQT